jgi:beta-lactamase superfamily II metal-dependent hydrolase
MYSTNKHLPRIRRDVAIFAKKYGLRKASRHYGYAVSAIHRWTKILDRMGHHPIPTKSSRPHSHPQTTDESIVKKIVDKRIEVRRSAEVHVGKKGDEIIFGDGVVVHILYPGANFHGDEKDTNRASVSMVITYGDESVLLTGDLPSTHEGELLNSVLPHNITIYKAGHHGSKFSSGEQLLSYIHPEYVVISAGKDNKYGHPNGEALARLATYSHEIL